MKRRWWFGGVFFSTLLVVSPFDDDDDDVFQFPPSLHSVRISTFSSWKLYFSSEKQVDDIPVHASSWERTELCFSETCWCEIHIYGCSSVHCTTHRRRGKHSSHGFGRSKCKKGREKPLPCLEQRWIGTPCIGHLYANVFHRRKSAPSRPIF